MKYVFQSLTEAVLGCFEPEEELQSKMSSCHPEGQKKKELRSQQPEKEELLSNSLRGIAVPKSEEGEKQQVSMAEESRRPAPPQL
ncbi:UNVERIFIED_CONTAM: hypothetical protein FKN15_019861 [Acipenser sinensis]